MYREVSKDILLRFLVVFALLMPLGMSGGLPIAGNAGRVEAQAEIPTASTIALRVVSARTEPKAFDGAGVIQGDPITQYKYLINIDDTGDPFEDETNPDCVPSLDDGTPNPNYPGTCNLPSIRTVPGWAEIYTQGDQDDLSESVPLTLPDGKYLISVKADGYKMDGEHFTIPAPDPDGDGIAVIEVQMHPYPLPPATMVIKVFEDNAMTNGQFDGLAERGLEGFRASLNDIAGEITTDIFGNPLCTIYEKDANGDVVLDADGAAVIQTLGQGCYSDAEGLITIPNIGPMRYDVLVFPPVGEEWIQTTTLEGALGWDTWLQEAGTGLDNEFLIAAEPFPWTIFAYVRPTTPPPDWVGTGTIKGVIMGASTWVPAEGGLPYVGDTFGGFAGTKLHRPIVRPWLSLNDLQRGDVAVWVGRGNEDGSFEITGVPDGNYFLTYWDEKLHYILDFVQVTVSGGQVADVGTRMLTGWFTEVSGHVFHDVNENGRRDDGEPGIANYTVVLRDRDNTEIDRMSVFALTDQNGFYELEKGYPMGAWMVLEAYSDLHRTTGITYQTLNMKEEVTLVDNIVDIGIFPILGQPVRLDWGVKPYDASKGENGGIAGTVFYDTVRAEDEARYAGAEPWQPGIPDVTVNLYEAVVDDYGQLVLDPDGGAAVKGSLVATTVTERFERPKGCQVLDVNGDPVDLPSIPPADANQDCLEGIVLGTQIGDGQNNLDGNWGFSEVMFNPDGTEIPEGERPPLPPGHYLVEVVIPEDDLGKPMFQVTREEDINIFDGDEFLPEIPPPACAGPLHIVDVLDAGEDYYAERILENGITVPASTPVENPGYAAEYDAGFARYEGQAKPLCNVKHVYLSNGKAVAPIFTLFTEVPIPGRWKGYIIDDLNVSVDPDTLFFGEMAGVPKVPIGLYDYAGRLVHTVHSDFNGVYEAIMPSDGTVNAPSPSGMFANVYYQYGNDPGPIGAPNERYNPQYRSIGTSFEIYPGVIIPADLAPSQSGSWVQAPGAQPDSLSLCRLEETQPQLYAVDRPYGARREAITIRGIGFGAAPGILRLGATSVPTTSWSDTEIAFAIPNGMSGPQQLSITTADGQSTVNGITIHVMASNYRPTVYEVGPGRGFDPAAYDAAAGGPGPIQAAIDAAWAAGGQALVVVYPGQPVEQVNPLGMYIENPVLYAPVKLQGVGPGGIYTDGAGNTTGSVPGSIIDGRGVGGDSPYNVWWRHTFIPDIWDNRGGWDRAFVDGDGNPTVYEGAVITVLAEDGEFGAGYPAAIDGFIVQGGDQQGFPNNRQFIGGEVIPGAQPNVVVQGGGIYVHGYGRNLRITNNLIQSNGGAYGGAVRLGTPHIYDDPSSRNEGVVISYNRILANGGTNLAGAIALFNGSDNYEIAHNDICGNSSLEYGGGISHYGYSPNGTIHHNRIYFNSSYDEGGGVMIAGELQANPATLSPGAGPVDVYNNLIYSNLANDDGGGLRFLMAGNYVYNVYNNMIVGNVSTHEGGGISLNDAPSVRVVNNTIMKNITTATAMTSDGSAAPAGLSSSRNSLMLQATLPATSPIWSDPVLFNNIFWDNRAGFRFETGISGIGLTGDPWGELNYWDLGVADGSGLLSPTYSILQVTDGTSLHDSNLVGLDPMVVNPVDTRVGLLPWRANPNLVGAHIVVLDVPAAMQGDYHLTDGSPAINVGTASIGQGQSRVNAPWFDYDNQPRPYPNGNRNYDIGADELSSATSLWMFIPEESSFSVALPMIQRGDQ